MTNDPLVVAASELATTAHEGQQRKYGGGPYIEHPRRVAAKVATLDEATVTMVAAAHLHDAIEDTALTQADIAARIAPEVGELVAHLTNPSKGSDAPRAERKRMDRDHLLVIPREAKLIKLCDRIDNLGEMRNAPLDFLDTYAGESELLLTEALAGTHAELETELAAAIAQVRRWADAKR